MPHSTTDSPFPSEEEARAWFDSLCPVYWAERDGCVHCLFPEDSGELIMMYACPLSKGPGFGWGWKPKGKDFIICVRCIGEGTFMLINGKPILWQRREHQ